jgi:hypothetical protein
MLSPVTVFNGWVNAFRDRCAGQPARHSSHGRTHGGAHGHADRSSQGSQRRAGCQPAGYATRSRADSRSDWVSPSPATERIAMGIALGLFLAV